ncbi:PH domain-containing protein [Actinomadura verrucosospora]|uniref:Bacterial PH domain protein n=1 Tax=Actinomadura verrucosospora TaxID=46165 RepID=A0A7D3VV28_ACTVE|nr:PH domain-containing protein [Actinomadura verrucosospora]QKG23478.1 bacterial PH domain protein [Actinomadura verrucosospora]
MGLADRYLAEDESLVYATRQHWTEMVGEFVILCLVWIVAGALLWFIPFGQDWGRIADYVVLALAAVCSLWFWLIPLLRWRGTVYILTTKRIYKRTGLLTKTGHSIPLSRVNDVSYRVTLWERIWRYGTLDVQSASEHGMLRLKRVPDPGGLRSRIYTAVDNEQNRYERGPDQGAPGGRRG